MKAYITALTRTIMFLTVSCAFAGCGDKNHRSAIGQGGTAGYKSKSFNTISPEAFVNPPIRERPAAYWCWCNGNVDHLQMTREMERVKARGMRGFEIRDVGVYRPKGIVPNGPAFFGEESLKSIKHAMAEAKRIGLEVKVTNVWNNRLAGDQLLSEEKRITRTYLQGTQKKNSPLVPSGLLGPVTLQPVK